MYKCSIQDGGLCKTSDDVGLSSISPVALELVYGVVPTPSLLEEHS